MKWYKHISDSLDDPFIFDLMSKHGSDGYVVFFGTLEIYSREFKPENGWKLTVSWSYFHQKLRISRPKLKKILSDISKWTVIDDGVMVSVFIPKFTELLDEWTQRKIGKTRELLGSESGQTPEILGDKKELDTDKEEDKETTLVPDGTPQPCPHQKIIEEYNRILGPYLPVVKPNLWKGKRASWLQARWKEQGSRQRIEWWTGFFEYVRDKCKFLLGENDREWKADLEWLVKAEYMVKILEGKYEKTGRLLPGNGSGKPRVLDGVPSGGSHGKESCPEPSPQDRGTGPPGPAVPVAGSG